MLRTVILLNGLPGSGKGTQTRLLLQQYELVVLASGDLLRGEIAARTAIGLHIAEFMTRGELIPDVAVAEVFAEKIGMAKSGAHILLEGFPRTIEQLSWLSGFLKREGDFLRSMIWLDVSLPDLTSRLSARRICPTCGRIYNLNSAPPSVVGICDDDGDSLIQRDDDKPSVMNKRLVALHKAEQTLLRQAPSYVPVYAIEGNRPPAAIFCDLADLMKLWLEPTEKNSGGTQQ